jgi:beta-N-acetylhexosaminidase
MKLFEEGRLDLDAPLSRYLPEYAGGDKGAVTVRQILTHTGGFGGLPREGRATDRAGMLRQVLEQPLESPPGTERYSDLGFIVLGQIIERITGETLDRFARRAIFDPLGMRQTGFRPTGATAHDASIVPTDHDAAGRLRQGEVHDDKARALGGVAGHAGLFSTAEDLERFARMLASGGTLDGERFLSPETINAFVGVDAGGRRALGWDRNREGHAPSAGSRFGANSFGHTGFTGTSLWIDPDRGAFAILLSNRVHPGGTPATIDGVRATVADLAHALAAPP